MLAKYNLIEAQKDGFARDAEQKAAKIVTDAYIGANTVDADLTNTGIDTSNIQNFINQLKTGITPTPPAYI